MSPDYDKPTLMVDPAFDRQANLFVEESERSGA
jgi:hypothetical protein